MATVEDERVEARVDELERLWSAPAAAPATRSRRTLPSLGSIVAALWGAFLLAVLAFEPTPSPHVVTPAWVVATFCAFWLALIAAGGLAWMRLPRSALTASACAGLLGVAIGYACRTTGHHLGSWWLAEAGACAALAAMSLLALATRPR